MALDPEKEFEGLYRTHDLDDPKFIAWLKKTLKSKSIRINRYIISDIIDGKLLKIQLEKFIKGVSQGTRAVKTYLSEEKCKEIVGLLDKIPRKTYQDTRTMEYRERPEKIIKNRKANLKELDLDKLFD